VIAPVVDHVALDCLGFGGDPAALVTAVLPRVQRLSLVGDSEVLAWTDEASGARLVLGCRGPDVQWMWPTLWSPPSALLGALTVLSEDVVAAAVLDAAGSRLARLVLRLEQGRTLTPESCSRTWPAAVVATGPVRVFADAPAFHADPASIHGDPASYPARPPEHFTQRGWAWPPRTSEESLEPDGDSLPVARLTGSVVAKEHRRNELTGHQFIVARVRTLGLELDLCLPERHDPVPVGSVVSGRVGLVGRLGPEPGGPRQRWVQSSG
jgi:hypothetical protein